MKILVVDNSALICERLRALLLASGKYEVLDCADGTESAMDLVESCQPDALLLDLQLNDGNGFELLELIRNRKPALPVIVLSLSNGWHYRNRAQELGAKAYLCKSSEFEEIVPTLDRVFRLDPNCLVEQSKT